MTESLVSWDRQSPVGVISLRRLDRRNALNDAMWDGLRAAFGAAKEDPPRVLILYGEGGHFSVGTDLSPECPMTRRIIPAVTNGDAKAAREVIEELKFAASLVAGFPTVTIAAIEGSCVGGGLELALACDLRVAATTARLGLPEVRVGFVPDIGGTARLTQLIGRGRAAELILTARLVSGDEAHRIGLVERLAEPGQALAVARALALEIAGGAPTAVDGALGVIRRAGELPIAEALALETQAGVAAMVSGEPGEGVAAFLEKRAPRWKKA